MKRILTLSLFLILVLTASVYSFAAPTDRSELSALLAETYNSALYTSESYYPYQLAVNNALNLYENPEATQEQINDACLQLTSARDALMLTPERETLMFYANNLDGYIYNAHLDLSDETMQKLKETQDMLRTLVNKAPLMPEELTSAEEAYNALILEVERADNIEEFSTENPASDVVIPENYFEDSSSAGRAAGIRLTMILIGTGLLAVGVTAVILYFKPPKFLK